MAALTMEAAAERTNRFYSHFCGTNIAALGPGMHFICTPERDAVLQGYGCRYTLYLLVKGAVCVAAYSPKHSQWMEPMKAECPETLLAGVSRRHRLEKMKLMQFTGDKVDRYGDAKVLRQEDYPLFEAFFQTIHPGSRTEGWLREYFMEKAAKGYFTGYHAGGRLLSVCDAPDMPYMEDEIQHTGICTLPEARRQGYARYTAALAAHTILAQGVCPQWECHAGNAASVALAQSIGYREFATAYILKE